MHSRNAPMRRLPSHYAPFVFAVIQSAMTTGIATAIAAVQLSGFGREVLSQWLIAWLAAWLTMIPIVILMAPVIQRLVRAMTTPVA